MIILKSFRVLLLSGLCFYLTSCGNNNSSNSEQTKTDTTTATTNSTATKPVPTSTTITTPQNLLVVIHKVGNYAKWKAVYDGDDTARAANGIHNYVIGRGVTDSNMVLVALKIEDTAKAINFMKNPALKKAMTKGGVMGAPKSIMYTALFQDTAKLDSKLRSSVTFTVKDWDTWFNNFKTGEQERTNNGIAIRSYGHDSNDPHKVRVVTALLDSAKAMAYFQSDSLKKRMQASGVTSKPDRFIYRIVELY